MLKQFAGKATLTALEPPADVGPERELLLRIAASRIFHRAARLRDLLLYIGDRTLAGKNDDLSEHSIGVNVFGRQENYSSGDDNIVRASVRQLRIKLQEYFDLEGKDEPLKVEIPKGGYLAVFSVREVPASPQHSPASGSQPALARTPKALIATLAGACIVLVVACAYLIRDRISAVSAGASSESHSLVAAVMGQTAGPVRFVLTDSALVVGNGLPNKPVSLNDYAARGAADPTDHAQDAASEVRWNSRRQITSLADVLVLSRLLQEMPQAGRRIEVKHARFMTARDFKSGNFILTGSPRANPWAGLFEPAANFRFESEGSLFRNMNPVKGEPAGFAADPARHIDYARVALLRNLSGTGFVLLVAGGFIEGTEGAGEFILRDDSKPAILKALGLKDGDPLSPFEIVLEVTTLEGTARSTRIVASRRY